MEELPWDPLCPCTDRSDEWWSKFLFDDLIHSDGVGEGARGVSRMSLIAFSVFKSHSGGKLGLEDARECARDFYGDVFPALLAKRDASYTCAAFRKRCRTAMTWYAIAWGVKETKISRQSLDALIQTTTDDFDLHEVLGEFDPGFDLPLLEDDARCKALALEDLPEQERLLAVALQTADDPREVEGANKEKSRARENYDILYRVHEQNESREGARIIRLVISRRVEDACDQKLARGHLFEGQSLDCLKDVEKARSETADEVRHRFLSVARLVDPICGGNDHARAFYLLPATGKAILRVGKYLPWQQADGPKPPAAGSWLEVLARERAALSDLAVLYRACVHRRSPTGRTSLFFRGKRVGEPGSLLIKSLIVERETVETAARESQLTDEAARKILLTSLRDTEYK